MQNGSSVNRKLKKKPVPFTLGSEVFVHPKNFFLFVFCSIVICWTLDLNRVKCERSGGLRFTITGNSHFYQVLVTNVGSDGEVMSVKVKGSKTGWIPMARNWGQNWQCNVNLKGQPLSFEVTTSDKIMLTAYNVAPANWQFGQTFEGKQF